MPKDTPTGITTFTLPKDGGTTLALPEKPQTRRIVMTRDEEGNIELHLFEK